MNCLHLPIRRDFNLIDSNNVYEKSILRIKSDLLELLDLPHICCGYDYIESINPNPVGIPTLANMMCCIKGDIISRILNIKPVYYVNDAGLNFSKFLLNHRMNPDEKLEQVYSFPCNEESLLKVRYQVHENYPEDALKIRDQMVKKILCEYEKINVLTPRLIYQSNYNKEVKSLISNAKLGPNGYYIKDIQVATSTKIPLYIAADYCYHLDIDRQYTKKLQLVSKDHCKYIKSIDTLTGTPWNYSLGPIIVLDGTKLSKRKCHDLTLDELIKLNPKLSSKEISSIIKLYLMKYEKRDKLDLEQLKKEVLEPKLLKLIHFIDLPDSGEDLINQLEEKDIDPVIRAWANIKEVMHYVCERLDVNKLYKFLEHVQLQKSSNSKLHHILMRRLVHLLGL